MVQLSKEEMRIGVGEKISKLRRGQGPLPYCIWPTLHLAHAAFGPLLSIPSARQHKIFEPHIRLKTDRTCGSIWQDDTVCLKQELHCELNLQSGNEFR